MENQLEPGHCCPIVMTSAAIPVLRRAPGNIDTSYVKKLKCQQYDSRDIPMSEKASVTAGMSMTEKQGGSDVRANTTLAQPLEHGRTGPGAAYLLQGHKWFTSAPMCDFFLTLAKTSEHSAPSCFLVPRWLPSGDRNTGFKFMRLKEKCADRANASSEVEYDEAWGLLISEEGKGVKSIIEMVNSTRMDCTLGSAAAMKRSLQLALVHTVFIIDSHH
jgi:putative acyl-CoA dehydrogenase